MNKKLLSSLFAFGLSTFCFAEKTVMINGSEAEKSDVSEITFAGDNLELKYADGSTFKLDIETIEINFSDATSVGGAVANSFSLSSMVDDQLSLTGLEIGMLVQIIRVDGRVLYSAVADGDAMNISVAGLSPAPYLIKVGKQIVKFIKK